MARKRIRQTSDRWPVREATAEDAPGIRELFHEVFGQAMTEDLWQWKYGGGRGHAVLAEREGRVVAHYGGIRRTVTYQGEAMPSVQCVDTMVKSTERGTLSRRGPYYRVAYGFLDRFVGYGRLFAFGFGFPNKRVMRVGEILGVQAPVGEVVEPVWLAANHTRYRGERYSHCNSSHREAVNTFWLHMQDGLRQSIVGVRDAVHLNYRYLENPIHRYEVDLVSAVDGNDPIGIIVTRIEGHTLLLLDLIGDVQRFPELVEHARFRAMNLGLSEMRAWITTSHLDLLGSQQSRVVAPKVMIPTSVCTEGPTPDELRDKWWLMAGDTDFR